MKATPVRRGRGLLSAILVATLALAVATAASLGSATAAAAVDCGAPRTASSNADAWIDQGSTSSNKGTDSILKVRSQGPDGNFRALVRFPAPAAAPEDCVLQSATLRVYAPSPKDGRTVQALRLASAWSEGSVTWANQPATAGAAAGTDSGSDSGYREWNVTAQVQEGAAHGFLIRDSAENSGGEEQSFHSREKGETPPQLVVQYAPPPDPTTQPPQPPQPATVACGQVITSSTLVMNNLSDCLGDGLVVGAPRIIVDLNGHTIDGVGLGAGVRNDGFDTVTVRNGAVRDFDHGVQLDAGTTRGRLERLTLELNQLAAIELTDADGPDGGNEIRSNTIEGNGYGISLVNTSGASVTNNTLRENANEGLALHDSSGNRIEANSFTGGSDRAIELFASTDNILRGNTVSGSGDGGIDVVAGSHRNRIEGNTLTATGDSGVLVGESDGNQLIANTAHGMSDSGITMNAANDSVVRDNDVRFNPTGLELSGSSRNLVTGNDASESMGIGIELGGFANHVVLNTASSTGADGIVIADDALLADLFEPGVEHANVVERNTTSANLGDGIHAAKGGHEINSNVARDNGGWGIYAQPGTTFDANNVATGNAEPGQCFGVVCRDDTPPPPDSQPPDTSITSGPDDDTEERSATFTFTGADDRSEAAALRFECRLDGAAFGACTSPRSYANLSPGTHTFEVRAIDEAGNADPTPATDTWTITAPPAPVDCGPAITVPAEADAWIDQASVTSNKGDDSVLKVRSQRPSGNFRALVRFAIDDDDVAEGCAVQSATLRLYAGGAKTGRTLQALRVASDWSERLVNWSNQPATEGAAATTASGQRWREWAVTAQVQAMYDTANHGFLIRDAAEGGNGDEQSLHSREKVGDNPPQLVVRFAPAP